MSCLVGEVAGVESTVPGRPVVQSDCLQSWEGHGHDVAVVAFLAPFADTVGAPVATNLGFWERLRGGTAVSWAS